MSENFKQLAKCSVCGNPINQCTCSPEQKANRRILIEHKFTGTPQKPVNTNSKELERLRKENEELNQILSLNAEKEFEVEKNAVVSQFPEDRQEKIMDMIGENPDVLEQIKTQLALNPIVDESKSRRAPKGKAGLPNSQNNEEITPSNRNPYHEYLDDLFKKARLSQNPIEKEKANTEIESLYNEYEKAMFEHKNSDFKTTTTQCIQCGAILTGSDAEKYTARKIPCPRCSYKGGIVRNPKGQSW